MCVSVCVCVCVCVSVCVCVCVCLGVCVCVCVGSIVVTVRALQSRAVNLCSLSTTVGPAGPEALTDRGENLLS